MPVLRTPPRNVADADKLYQHLREVHSDMLEMQATIEELRAGAAKRPELRDDQIEQIRDALQASGAAPLNLTGAIGKMSEPQLPAPVSAVNLASLPSASNYLLGTFAVTTTAPYPQYICAADAAGVHFWKQAG
jgi:hypothetical protein